MGDMKGREGERESAGQGGRFCSLCRYFLFTLPLLLVHFASSQQTLDSFFLVKSRGHAARGLGDRFGAAIPPKLF